MIPCSWPNWEVQFFIFVNLSLFVIYLFLRVWSFYILSLPLCLSLPFSLPKPIAHPVCEGLGGVEIRTRCASKMSFLITFCSSLEGTTVSRVTFFSSFLCGLFIFPQSLALCLSCCLWNAAINRCLFIYDIFSGEMTNSSFLMTHITIEQKK